MYIGLLGFEKLVKCFWLSNYSNGALLIARKAQCIYRPIKKYKRKAVYILTMLYYEASAAATA